MAQVPDRSGVDKPKTRPVGRVERALAGLCMAAMTVITFANVVSRYLTNVSLAFTEEVSVFLMVLMTLFGASAAAAQNRDIRVTFLVERLSAVWSRRTEATTGVVSAALFSVLALLSASYVVDLWRFEETSAGLGVPLWIYWMWLPSMSAVIALRFALRAWNVAHGRGWPK